MKSFKEIRTKHGKIVQAEDSPLYKKRDKPEGELHSPEAVHNALNTDATSRKIIAKNHQRKVGELTGVRLNINVLKNTGLPINTLHKATNHEGYKHGKGFYGGEAQNYEHVTTLKHAHFNVNQQGREDIATGKQSKFPMASVDGEYQKPEHHSFDGVLARFNPAHHHMFVDEHGRGIKSAEHVTCHGHRAYLRGKIEYHTVDTQPKRAGDAPSASTLHEEKLNATTYEVYFG